MEDDMVGTRTSQSSQATLWNGVAGDAWVEAQGLLDWIYKPLEDLLVESVSCRAADKVLDVGCGTGATTIAIARYLGRTDACDGIDISQPMIARARLRAGRLAVPARFICADAETYAFRRASYDMIVSRLGVMFFTDPLTAFRNMHGALHQKGGLQFIAWRSPEQNPFMTTAARAAMPLLPGIPNNTNAAQGPFAFADARYVDGVLRQTGWTHIDIRPIDIPCVLPEPELTGYLSRLGPLGNVFRQADEETRARVMERVRIAYEPYVHGDEVRFTAACWVVSAQA
jgi:SAM-dependent methyltransferase